MIDLHSHLLPGVDDGPEGMREALDMARRAVESGVSIQACTPHMHPRYPTKLAAVADGIATLEGELARREIPLRLVPGAEIDMGFYRTMDDEELARASLGGGRWLLIEMPLSGWPLDLPDLLSDAELRGFRVLLAHPERASSVQANPDRLRDAVGRGALCQITASSFSGGHGPRARSTAVTLVRLGMGHVLATDAHGARRRPPDLDEGLAAAAEALDVPVASLGWMVQEGPEAILAGEDARPPRFSRWPKPRTPVSDPEEPPGRPRPTGR